MAITSDTTAPISFSDIRNEFGGAAPDNLSEYYRGGANVPNDLGDAVVGATEVQTIPVTGTRSNVVAGASTNEMLLIGLPTDFNSGGPEAGDLSGSFEGTEMVPDGDFTNFYWPDGAFTRTIGTAGEWTVSVGDPLTINPDEDETFVRAGLFVNNSGGPITVTKFTGIIPFLSAGTFSFTQTRYRIGSSPGASTSVVAGTSLTGIDGVVDFDRDVSITYEDGEGFYIGISQNSASYTPAEFRVDSISIHTSGKDSLIEGAFSFDPDVENEVYSNNSSVVELDFTDAVWDTTDTSINGNLEGNWRTDLGELASFNGTTATLDDVVTEFFVEANTSLAENVTVTRPGDGNFIRIENSAGDMTFFVGDGSQSTGFDAFIDNDEWITPPVVRVGINGNIPTVYDYSNGVAIDTSPRVNLRPFTPNIGTDAALTEIGTAIEAIAPGITWDDTITDHSLVAIPSSITIDFTNAEYELTPTFFGSGVFGNWHTGGEEFRENLSVSSTIPPTLTQIIDEIETEMNSKLAAGFTLTRMPDDKLILAADSGDVTLRINDSSSTGNDDFDFDSGFTTQPIVRVLTPAVGTAAQDGDTELVGNSIEIDYTNAVITNSYSEYFFGNWHTGTPNGESAVVGYQPPIAVQQIADEYVAEINSKLRTDDGFTLTVDDTGLILTLSSPGRLSFNVGNEFDVFDFEIDWVTPPVVTQVLPTPGQTYVEGDARVDIGTDAFTGRATTIDLGTQTDIDTLFSLVQNGASNTQLSVVATHGVGGGGGSQPSSTYTIADYNGSVIDTFTRSVPVSSDSDVAAVISQAVGLISSNTETPVDFTAAADGSNIVITASVEAAVTGTWTLSVNHNNAAPADIGDIAFGVTSVQDGATPSPVTLINQSVPTSGPITTDDFRGAYDPDNPVNS